MQPAERPAPCPSADYGGFVALGPAPVAEMFGVQRLGALLGVLYTSAGLGSAVGPPLTGVLVENGRGYGTTVLCSLAVATMAAVLVHRLRPAPACRTGGATD